MAKRLFLFSLILVVCTPVFCGVAFSKNVGQLKSDTAGVTLGLEGPWWSKANIGPEAKAAELKSGNYKPKKLERVLVRDISKDAEKKVSETWRIYSSGPWGKLSRIKVEKGKTTVLKFGGPVVIKIDTKVIPVRGNTPSRVVSIGMTLVGEYGEVYSSHVRKGKKIVKPGSFKILSEDGKELAAGNFEYG